MPIEKPTFLKQKNMLRVLYALIPVALVAIYYFGWRVGALLGVSFLACFTTEWFMANLRKGKISYAVFVTAALYGLSLPPTTPYWIAAVGAVIAILFAKEVFGGFGKNIFNPAIVGRAFVYVSFPVEMTGRFVPVFQGFPGGFAQWSFTTLKTLPGDLAQTSMKISDAVTAATPMWARRDFGHITDIMSLFLGNISATTQSEGKPLIVAAGSVGEVSSLVIILAAIYLIVTNTAQWRLMVSTIIGAVSLNAILLYVFGVNAPSIPFTLFSGALLYGAVFMVTDPVSAPKVKLSQWIYGIFIGMMIVFFRFQSIFAGGLAFSILLGNMLAPSLDLWIKRIKAPKVESKKA